MKMVQNAECNFHGSRHGLCPEGDSEGGRYEGGWLQGKMHGHGVYVGADGSRFEGEYVNGVPQEEQEAPAAGGGAEAEGGGSPEL